jgi:hypothetical protein
MSVGVYGAYLTSYDDIKKALPIETRKFEERAEDLLVFLTLSYPECVFTMADIFEMCARDDLESCNIYNQALDKQIFEVLEGKAKEIYNLLCGQENSVMSEFKKQFDVRLGIDFNYEEEKAYFYFYEDDVVELTPSARKLRERGIGFEFTKWTESF